MRSSLQETTPATGPADSSTQAAPGANLWLLAGGAAMTVFYLATSIYIAAHRPYWFDEIFVVRIARLPSITTLWTALGHAADTMPPGYHLVMRFWCKLFGYGEVAVRLPSALAMIAGLLIVFDCARRLTDSLHGLIAFALLTCSLLPYYGYEARPYAFFFMLSALAFWIWTCTPRDSKWSAFWFGAVLGLAVTMHYYAVLNIVPYLLWEITRWKPGKRPSPKLVAGVIGVAVVYAALSPLAMSFSRGFSHGFWAHPSLYALREIFPELFPDGLFLFAMAMIWAALTRMPGRGTTAPEMQPAEALGWFFLSIPLAGFVLAELRTNAFLPRYFIGALPGIAVAVACWLWRYSRNAQRLSMGILLLLAAWGAVTQAMTVRHPGTIDPFGQQTALKHYLKLEEALHSDGKRYILLNNPMLHMEASHYSRYPEEIILMLRSDGDEDLPTVRVQVNLSHYSPMRLWKLNDLEQHAAETALIDPTTETVEALKRAGFDVKFRFSGPLPVVYLQ